MTGHVISHRFVVENPPLIFERRTPSSEEDFVSQLERCGPQLFPEHYLRRWSPIIRDQRGTGARPDMVLVSKNLDAWYVVEVELSSHSISGHIAPQLDTLSQGIYDSGLVPSLQAVLPELSQAQLRRLVYLEPGFLCIVDASNDAIYTACREANFELAIVEPYWCNKGYWAVAVRQMPRVLRSPVLSPARFELRRSLTRLGDTVFVELPRHFPNWKDWVLVSTTEGEVRKCTLITGSPCSLLLPARWMPEVGSAWLVIIDPQRKLVRLEVE